MKKFKNYFADSKNISNFAIAKREQPQATKVVESTPLTESMLSRPAKLPCGVMVARRILVPPVRVRILPRQQSKIAVS